MTVTHHKNVAILVGGGPAPGINSVISAATIRAQLEGIDVVGIRDGFEWLMQGNIEHTTPLTIESVSRVSSFSAARRYPAGPHAPSTAAACPTSTETTS